ncbi:MAG: hypothetical protein MJK04_20675, partial [Psychrosphaera sp.]|nr:hypothetical protein [Psychrosphaera sp.]
LGCMSLNSEATALVFEADAVTTGTTATIKDFVTLGSNAGVYLDPAHRPYSGISVFDVDNVDSYPSNNVENAFSIGCSVVNVNDPGCAHSTANIATGQYTGNMSTLLPVNRYNSSEALWPWVNEAQIKRDMCASVNRGFCSFEGTLSEYIHSL